MKPTLIRLTNKLGNPIYLNANAIQYFMADNDTGSGTTHVAFIDGKTFCSVLETPDAIFQVVNALGK